MSNCPSVSLSLCTNCISYHPQRMLHTLSVTNLLPNFIPVYQQSNRRSPIQACWCTGLDTMPHPPPPNLVHPELVLNVALFGNKVFADVIKSRCSNTRWSGGRGSPNPMADILKEGNRNTHRESRGRNRSCAATAKVHQDSGNYQKLEVKKVFPRAFGGGMDLLTIQF